MTAAIWRKSRFAAAQVAFASLTFAPLPAQERKDNPLATLVESDTLPYLSPISQPNDQTFEGSFSAVSARISAKKKLILQYFSISTRLLQVCSARDCKSQ